MKKIRVVSIDDEPLIRHAVKSLLERHEHIELVGEGNTGEMVVPLVREHNPDILLLDLSMPGDSIISTATERFNTLPMIKVLTEEYPKTKVILLTGHQIPAQTFREIVRSSTVCGYLLKSDTLSMHLHSAIDSVKNGGVYYSETIGQDMLNPEQGELETIDISDRQLEIIKAIYDEPDLKSPELAEKLEISESTLKTHLNRIFKILGVSNKTAAVVKCIKLKLIDTA